MANLIGARLPSWVRAAGALLVLLVLAGLLLVAAGATADSPAANARHLVVYALAVALILARCVTVPAGRWVWAAFGAGALSSLLAEAIWVLLYRDSPTSPAGFLFASGYVSYGVGLALYLRRRVGDALRTLGFDAIGIAVYLLAVGSAVLLQPIVRHSGLSDIDAALSLASPAADAAIFSVVLATASFTGRRRGLQDVLLVSAFAVQCATDLAFSLDLAGQVQILAPWKGCGWELGIALLAAAAWAPPAGAGRLLIGGWWESAPTLSWIVAGGGVLVAAWAWQLPTTVVVLAAATLALAAVRSVRVTREVRALVVTRAESLVDPLTGLPNRRAVFEELELLTREDGADGRRVALIIFDLSGFRELTDTLGRDAARELLLPVAVRLAGVVPGMLARLTDDEFAVIVEDADPRAVAGAIRAALATPVTVEGLAVIVRPVMGYARFPEDAANPAELDRRAGIARRDAADRALDLAAYDCERDEHSLERLGLVTDLRAALSHDAGLWLAFQPQIDLRTGAVCGLEALIRWRHPTRGELSPAEFLPAAHLAGQMAALTDWVIERAVAEAAALRSAGFDLSISVNISPVTLVDVALPDRIAAVLLRHDFPPAQLVVEVTEDAVMSDRQRCLDALDRITALGVEVSIDDFGTGQSSLAQLRHVPSHELKIDRSFVNGMKNEPLDAEIVHLVIALGSRLGRRVVAEGIETPEQREILTALGCHIGQGFGLGCPMPAAALRSWLANAPAGTHEAAVPARG